MFASELIVSEITPVSPANTGDDALRIMEDFFIRHLPIVDEHEVIGIISEELILEHDTNEPLESYQMPYKPAYVKANDHVFEVLELISLTNLTCIPVVDNNQKYLGVITLEKLVQSFASEFSFNEAGAILVLEINRVDYSLTEISRIVESENGMILSSFISQNSGPDPSKIYVTLKINLLDVQYLKATFERYNYVVLATFTETEYIDTLNERYESLMNFLNI